MESIKNTVKSLPLALLTAAGGVAGAVLVDPTVQAAIVHAVSVQYPWAVPFATALFGHFVGKAAARREKQA